MSERLSDAVVAICCDVYPHNDPTWHNTPSFLRDVRRLAEEVRDRREAEAGRPVLKVEWEEALELLERARDAMDIAESNEQMRCQRAITSFLAEISQGASR